MSSENGATAGPEFDFGGVTRKWGKRWSVLLLEATQIQNRVAAAADVEGVDVNLVDDLERISEIAAEQETMLAQVLVNVPPEWIHPDAPKKLDWSDPASFDELLLGKYGQIVAAMQEARASKN